ncbi:hypothetical protein D1007_04997 [Hordeum vulgare]|nr:hypothetical protein D1007_04997 [Hordeum vulgare]
MCAPLSPALLRTPSSLSMVDSIPREPWQLVKAPFWWRACSPNHHHSRRQTPPSLSLPTGRAFVKNCHRIWHKCLGKGPSKVDCRDPYKCLICRRSGHRAHQCSSTPPPAPQDYGKQAPVRQTTTPASSPPQDSAAPGRPIVASLITGEGMPRVGDPSLRPNVGHVTVVTTPVMDAQAASLANLAVVVWLGGNWPLVSASVIRDAVATAAGVDHNLLKLPASSSSTFAGGRQGLRRRVLVHLDRI